MIFQVFKSARAVEYTNCISAEECPKYNTKQFDGPFLDLIS